MNERRLDSYRGFNVRPKPPALPEHVPHRPTWTCRTCGDEWPCAPARELLMRQNETNPTSIAQLMWSYLEDYAFDAGPGPLSGAFDRFIAWTRPGRAE